MITDKDFVQLVIYRRCRMSCINLIDYKIYFAIINWWNLDYEDQYTGIQKQCFTASPKKSMTSKSSYKMWTDNIIWSWYETDTTVPDDKWLKTKCCIMTISQKCVRECKKMHINIKVIIKYIYFGIESTKLWKNQE